LPRKCVTIRAGTSLSPGGRVGGAWPRFEDRQPVAEPMATISPPRRPAQAAIVVVSGLQAGA
jgi:hypothetical protein